MQCRSLHSTPNTGSKRRADAPTPVVIANAVERFTRGIYSKTVEMRQGMRHQAFAAGLVDGSAAPFDDDHLEPCPCAVQCGGQPGGATTSDEQVDHVRLASAAFSTLIRVRSSAALSTENTSAVTHAECTNGSATPSATTAT